MNDRVLGSVMLVASVVGIGLYGWLVFVSEWAHLVLQVTGFMVVVGVLGICAAIGYTMVRTPSQQLSGEDAMGTGTEPGEE